MSHDAAEVQKHVRTYVVVFVALACLTVVTVAISYLHLPIAMAVIVALIVATIKASLVAFYFMHLISEKKIITSILLITIFMFIVCLALPSLTVNNSFGVTHPAEMPGLEHVH